MESLWRGEFAAARVDFDKAIEVEPKLRDAYTNRASANASLLDYERSIADSRMAIALNPRHPTTYLQFGSLGYCEYQLGRHREAVADFDEAIRSTPGNEPRRGSYHFYRSLSFRAPGARPRAPADAREARRLGVTVPDSYVRSLGGE